jgi:hypothetical protein
MFVLHCNPLIRSYPKQTTTTSLRNRLSPFGSKMLHVPYVSSIVPTVLRRSEIFMSEIKELECLNIIINFYGLVLVACSNSELLLSL